MDLRSGSVERMNRVALSARFEQRFCGLLFVPDLISTRLILCATNRVSHYPQETP